jgi:hypothetical protein
MHNGDCGVGGIYEFSDLKTAGKPYAGQTSNFEKRLNQHINSGKLNKADDTVQTEIKGDKLQREIAEHTRIRADKYF